MPRPRNAPGLESKPEKLIETDSTYFYRFDLNRENAVERLQDSDISDFRLCTVSAKQYHLTSQNDIADNMSYLCKCIKIKILLQKQIKSIVLGLAWLHLYLSSSFVPGPYFCSMAAKEKSTITVL